MKRATNSAFDKIRSSDVYGVPITFSFNGRDTCQTMIGGFFTIVTRAIIAGLLLM
jgi:hypothetical protein